MDNTSLNRLHQRLAHMFQRSFEMAERDTDPAEFYAPFYAWEARLYDVINGKGGDISSLLDDGEDLAKSRPMFWVDWSNDIRLDRAVGGGVS